MNPSSRPIWVRARKNVPDLPDTPSDLSEPSYARLLFDTRCEVSPSLLEYFAVPLTAFFSSVSPQEFLKRSGPVVCDVAASV